MKKSKYTRFWTGQSLFFSFTIGFILVIFVVTVLGFVLAFLLPRQSSSCTSLSHGGFWYFILKLWPKSLNKSNSRLSCMRWRQPLLQRYICRLYATLIVFLVQVAKKCYSPKDQVNRKIIINGITRVISLVPVITFVAPHIATVPIPHYIASVFICALSMLDSWSRIYMFKAPSWKKKQEKPANVPSMSSPRDIKHDNEETVNVSI